VPQTTANEEDRLMKLSTRKLASFVAAVAVAAILAGLATTAAFAKKPDGKDRKTTFSIEAQIYWRWPPNWHYSEGFRAKGAIRDFGSIEFDDRTEMFPLTLVGKRGSLYIESDGDVFVISDATGDHADAIGATGSVVIVSENITPIDSLVLQYMYYLTFEGALPPSGE
jgi:hypothetical protein